MMCQPIDWNLIKMECCRCNAPEVIDRTTLERYDRESKVFLCGDCEVCND